ncbi:hypothetical protein RUND412_005795 [Rhizina undulata]
MVKELHPVAANLGRSIFIYNNIQTNQVIYSLTRTLKNTDALKQLTYVGKKSVPRALRKDVWTPLASVHFPFPALGLKTFHKLREFRKLHETAYDPKILHTTKVKSWERKKYLMDQKANSIADLAESLNLEITKANKNSEAEKVNSGDVVIRWTNLYDAEYAKEWPEEVLHDDAGRPVRYTATVPGEKSKEEVEVAETTQA